MTVNIAFLVLRDITNKCIYMRSADKFLDRQGRKPAELLGKKENNIQRDRQTDTSLLLDYEKTFDEGRMTLSFMQCTRTTEG